MKHMVIAYQDFTPSDPAVRARNDEAFITWQNGARLFPYRGARTSKLLGDNRGVPFVRDILDAAFASGKERIAIITNNDIRFGNGLLEAVKDHCDQYFCYWAYRVPCPGGEPDGGIDLFAMTRGWWKQVSPIFPDLLIGYSYWDRIMMEFMKWSRCPEGPRLYFHTPHPGIETRRESRGERYNQTTARRWLRGQGEPE